MKNLFMTQRNHFLVAVAILRKAFVFRGVKTRGKGKVIPLQARCGPEVG